MGVSVLVLKRGVDEYNLQAVAVTIGDKVFPLVTDDNIDAVDMCRFELIAFIYLSISRLSLRFFFFMFSLNYTAR